MAAGSTAAPLAAHAQRFNDELVTSESGLRIMDIKKGEGTAPRPGDVVEVHWSGVTKVRERGLLGDETVRGQRAVATGN